MQSDIVIPKDNEIKFAQIASKPGIKKLYFLYEAKIFNEDTINSRLNAIKKEFNLSSEAGFIITSKDADKIKDKSKIVIAKSSDKDRFLAESKKIKLIYGFESPGRKDYIHQRASGLNHIMCELLRKNNIVAGFSYGELINSNEVELPLIMGRIMQNLILCRKYKVKTAIASFAQNPFDLRAPHDVSNMFQLLGMDEQITKESFSHNL